jgi:hypothetical protein
MNAEKSTLILELDARGAEQSAQSYERTMAALDARYARMIAQENAAANALAKIAAQHDLATRAANDNSRALECSPESRHGDGRAPGSRRGCCCGLLSRTRRVEPGPYGCLLAAFTETLDAESTETEAAIAKMESEAATMDAVTERLLSRMNRADRRAARSDARRAA